MLDGPQDPIIEIDDSPPRNRRHRPSPPVSPGDTALARLRRVNKDKYIARIIRKLGDAGGQIIGVVRERSDGLWLIPADRRERHDYQLEKDTKAAHGDLLVCEKLPGPRMAAKRARMKENIGAADDPHAFSLISIAEQGLPTVFPEAVMAEAEAVEEAGLEGREDLTALPFITIDPADARDHDDAVFAEPDPDIKGALSSGWRLPMLRLMSPLTAKWTGKQGSAAIRFICPTASCRCCPNSCRMIYAPCAKTRRALHAVKINIAANGQKPLTNFTAA